MQLRGYTPGLIAVLLTAGCGGGGGITFFGRAYDGVTGARLTGYDVVLQYADQQLNGGVEEDGRYHVGPLPYFNDYTIAISLDGYRPFLSHNAMPVNSFEDETFEYDITQNSRSYYFDAILFPTTAVAPALNVDIALSESTQRPAGTMRLWPSTDSSLISDAVIAVSNGHIGDQIWTNDEDLQAATKQFDFTAGHASLGQGELTFGVTYNLRIFNIPGYQEITDTFVAGLQEVTSYVALAAADDPLTLAFNSNAPGSITPDGTLTLVFNQPIAFDDTTNPLIYFEAVDDAFDVSPDDTDGLDLNLTVLQNGAADDPDNQENGTTVSIQEDVKLVFSWSQNLGASDPDDEITNVIWSSLNNVVIRPAAGTKAQAKTVACLLDTADPCVGVNSVDVQVRQLGN